mgnify:CR=1 FL=1
MGADDVILDRLLMLRNEVGYLKREREALHTIDDYRGDPRLRRAVERSLQDAIKQQLTA